MSLRAYLQFLLLEEALRCGVPTVSADARGMLGQNRCEQREAHWDLFSNGNQHLSTQICADTRQEDNSLKPAPGWEERSHPGAGVCVHASAGQIRKGKWQSLCMLERENPRKKVGQSRKNAGQIENIQCKLLQK